MMIRQLFHVKYQQVENNVQCFHHNCVAMPIRFYLTVSGITIQSLKLIGQFLYA